VVASVYGTAIVPKTGTDWSVVVGLPQRTVTTYTATSTDEAGNVSGVSNGVVITESAMVPVINSQYPAMGTGNVDVGIQPYVTFSKAMASATIIAANVQLKNAVGDAVIPASVALASGGTQAVITPTNPLTAGTTYYVFVSTAVTDAETPANHPTANYGSATTSQFTVGTPIVPAVSVAGPALLTTYKMTEAATRFGATGLQITVANAQSATFNGLALNLSAVVGLTLDTTTGMYNGTFTAVSNTDAVTQGIHNYSIAVTSKTGNTSVLNIAYVVNPDNAAVITAVANSGMALGAGGATATATITWQTDIATTGVVKYGTTADLGTTSAATASGLSHSVTLTGLPFNTTYYYVVETTTSVTGTNAGGVKSTYLGTQFTTMAASSGIVVNYQTIKSYATADNTYGNGWEFKFNVTVNNPSQAFLKMKFSDWINNTNGGTNPVPANMKVPTNGNVMISLTDNIAAAKPIGNSYNDQANTDALSLVDENPNVGGIQATIYVFIKVPTGTTGGAFSSGYGIKTDVTNAISD
jgi:hypothetical protein